MPTSPKRPCRYPGCPGFCEKGEIYCPTHSKEARAFSDTLRSSSRERGYDGKWRKARDAYLKRHPLCVECLKQGKARPATVVDHIIPHRGDQKLFWDSHNWQALCVYCHARKTSQGM